MNFNNLGSFSLPRTHQDVAAHHTVQSSLLATGTFYDLHKLPFGFR